MNIQINFTIFEDYTKYVDGYEPFDDEDLIEECEEHFMESALDYSEALEKLNENLEELVSDERLQVFYDDCILDLDIKINDGEKYGSIYGDNDYMGACWEGIKIDCEIPNVNIDDFDENKLEIIYPDTFEVEDVLIEP